LYRFFEWKTVKGKKQPYYITQTSDEKLIQMAGLYDVWTDNETGDKLYTYTILTINAAESISWYF